MEKRGKITMWKNFIRKILKGSKIEHGGMQYVAAITDIDEYHNNGVKYLQKKKYEQAIEQFRKEAECDPGDFSGYWYLGKTYRNMGNSEESRKNYEKAINNAKKRYEKRADMTWVIEKIMKDFKEGKE